ncbi:MAG: hypothetical protein AB8V23_05475 [Candidatus Midichloria sp.]
MSALLGNGNGTFQTTVSYNVGTSPQDGIVLADCNQNGKLDIIIVNTNAGSNTVSMLLGNGGSTFKSSILLYFIVLVVLQYG